MTSFEDSIQYLEEVIRQGMERFHTPAVTIAWTDREKLLYVNTWGNADPEKQTPLNKQHLFNFGSIGKSFTAICLLKAEEKGWLDLQAPVTRYLPWFEVQSQYRPITLHDLMTHSSGLIRGADEETEALGEVWNLRHTRTGYTPGEKFYYSNCGYKTLGLVLEKVYGMPYPQIVRTQIFEPLGMKNSEPALTHAVRPRFARGYLPLYDDRPIRHDYPLVSAAWVESASADGCLSSNAQDLAAYARMLLNHGETPAGRIFSAESFAKMTTPYMKRIEEDADYGYGMMMWEEDGAHCIGHSGSIVGYRAFMRLDMDNGLAAIMMMTEPGMEGAWEIPLKVLRSAALGKELPANPFEKSVLHVENASNFTGLYTGSERSFVVRAVDNFLIMLYCGDGVVLEPRGKDAFLAHHPHFDLFLLKFSRGAGEEGQVCEAAYGSEYFLKGEKPDATNYTVTELWPAFVGHYRSHNPWNTNFRVVLRKDQLIFVQTDGTEAKMIPLGEREFLLEYEDDPVVCDYVEFDAVAEGKALIARLTGANYYRFFTP